MLLIFATKCVRHSVFVIDVCLKSTVAISEIEYITYIESDRHRTMT